MTPEEMLSTTLEIVVCFNRIPTFGKKGVTFLSRAYERRDKFLYLGNSYKEFERYVKKGLVSEQLSPWGLFWGNSRGSCCVFSVHRCICVENKTN
jgi:hypothetical protein